MSPNICINPDSTKDVDGKKLPLHHVAIINNTGKQLILILLVFASAIKLNPATAKRKVCNRNSYLLNSKK